MVRSQAWLMLSGLLLVCAAGCGGVPVSTDSESGPDGVVEQAANAEMAAPELIPDAALSKTVKLSAPPNSQYPGSGPGALVDGRVGSEDYYDSAWMGWWYQDAPFEATIDLGKVITIDSLGLHTLTCPDSWIFYPRSVVFEVSSDGENYSMAAKLQTSKADLELEYAETKTLRASDLGATGRYVRVRAERYGELPDWHMGHGGADGYEGQAWLFVDEVTVNAK